MPELGSGAVAWEMQSEIAVLTFDRPEKRNAVNRAMIEDVNRFFAAPPEGARAVLLAGAGPHFCAGLDLAEHRDRTAAEGLALSRYWHRTLETVQFGGLPVLAALRGAVMGGGLEIAAAAHVRVAEPSTVYQLPEGRRGFFVGGGASVRVSRIIGAGRTVEMMLTGRRYGAEEGQALGLSHYLVGEGEAFDTARGLARTVAANAPLVNDTIMLGIERIADMPMAGGFYTEALASALTQTTGDAAVGIDAFLEKREARFDRE